MGQDSFIGLSLLGYRQLHGMLFRLQRYNKNLKCARFLRIFCKAASEVTTFFCSHIPWFPDGEPTVNRQS